MGDPSAKPLRALELVRTAQQMTDQAFLSHLGNPILILVGPRTQRRNSWTTGLTAETLLKPSTLKPADFAGHEVFCAYEHARGVPIRIGRAADNDLVVRNGSVSSYHAELEPKGGGRFLVKDLMSQNGTLVEGSLVLPGATVPIRYGQRLQIGSRVFKLYEPGVLRRTLSRVILAADSD